MGTRTRLRRAATVIAALACAGAVAPAWNATPTAATRGSSSAAAARPLGCLIEPDRIADVGTQVVGLVSALHVDRGDRVRAGQRLLSMAADVERANVGVAERRARVDADVRAAEVSLVMAQQKMTRADSLVTQSFISEQALEVARGENELAVQKLRQAQSQREIWAQERRVAEAQLALRTVRSPFDGVVAERFVNLGERVEDRPLMRVAVIDPLRVELMVPTSQYGSVSTGDRVSIQPELPGAQPVFATVTHVDRVLDAASNSFRVRLKLPNPQLKLPAGLRCKAELATVAEESPAANKLRPAPIASRASSDRVAQGR
jgi:RND family efflux transporter MFP subunit